MRATVLAVLSILLGAIPSRAEPVQAPVPEKAPEVRPTHAGPPVTFESLWAAYLRADRSGDAENARRVFQEIRRLRVERNVEGLQVVGLAMVGQGIDRLKKGEKERAEELLESAAALAPRLPESHAALATLAAQKGPVGLLRAARETMAFLLAPLPTEEGYLRLTTWVVPVLLLAGFLTTFAVAATMLLRHGTLLLYDLRESLGARRSRSVGLAFYVALLLAPLATFQGWGWLPFWWLAVLFLYLRRVEKLVAVVLVVAAAGVGPLVERVEARLETGRNPLFWASVSALSSEADGRSTSQLETAVRQDPDDRDLVFLLAAEYRKAGRYEDAAGLYREALRADPKLGIAINNLANLDFARGDYTAAIARYKQAIDLGPARPLLATHYYNLSLAHLQRFEMQPADEALSQAKRLEGSLIAHYDTLWKYDNGNYAVVDVSLDREKVWAKFDGRADGVARKNVYRDPVLAEQTPTAAGSMTRFAGFLAVFAVVAAGVWVWRGRTLSTYRCLKCGAASDRRADRNAALVGLCTQCYHLFVVRDGISAPARNRKLLEVQGEETRRARIFRILSILSPGCGQLYGQKTLIGLALVFLWYLTLSVLLLSGFVPLFGTSPSTMRSTALGGMAAVLVVLLAVANRIGPDFDVLVPVRRSAGKKARTE